MALIINIREYFSGEASRNRILSIISGLLFFAGWWLFIDAMSVAPNRQITTGQVFVGILGTMSFFMVNTIKNPNVWLLIGFVMGLASVIFAVWIMVADFINNPKKETWRGVAILIQNAFILVSSLVYRFGINKEDWNDS